MTHTHTHTHPYTDFNSVKKSRQLQTSFNLCGFGQLPEQVQAEYTPALGASASNRFFYLDEFPLNPEKSTVVYANYYVIQLYKPHEITFWRPGVGYFSSFNILKGYRMWTWNPTFPAKEMAFKKAFNYVNMEKEEEMFMFLYVSDNQSLWYYFAIYLFMGGSRNVMTSDNKQMRKKIQPCSLINNITQTASKHNKGNVKKYIYQKKCTGKKKNYSKIYSENM